MERSRYPSLVGHRYYRTESPIVVLKSVFSQTDETAQNKQGLSNSRAL